MCACECERTLGTLTTERQERAQKQCWWCAVCWRTKRPGQLCVAVYTGIPEEQNRWRTLLTHCIDFGFYPLLGAVAPSPHSNTHTQTSRSTMDQRLNLGTEVRELKLGSTFSTSNPRTSFHTLKCKYSFSGRRAKLLVAIVAVAASVVRIQPSIHACSHITYRSPLFFADDFKPASVDISKAATLDVSSNNQVTVTMPHLGEYQ